ncbi:hypothetical protein ACHQM5_015715 [Ranunculus cassubicifolius]
MNNYSQFNSNAVGGGGFTPSQAMQTPDNGFPSSSKNRDSQSLLPLTAKQIIDSIESSSTDVTNITMLGIVFRKVDNVTSVSFILDDGTGTIECHRWANDDFEKKEMDEIQLYGEASGSARKDSDAGVCENDSHQANGVVQ